MDSQRSKSKGFAHILGAENYKMVPWDGGLDSVDDGSFGPVEKRFWVIGPTGTYNHVFLRTVDLAEDGADYEVRTDGGALSVYAFDGQLLYAFAPQMWGNFMRLGGFRPNIGDQA